MKHPSASTASKLASCPASHVYPQSEVFSRAAEGGTDKHEAKGALVNKRPSKASKGAEALVEKVDWESIHGDVESLSAEDAYVYNVKSGELIELGRDIERQYEKRLGRRLAKYELPMSLDLTGLRGGAPWMRDMKFGNYADIWQLRVNAMALAKKHNASEVDTGFVFIDPATGEHYEEPHTLFVSDLDDYAATLARAWDKAEELEPKLAAGESLPTVEGSHCSYCGAYPHCPSKMKLVRGLLPELVEVEASVIAMTPEQRGRAWAKYQEAKRLLERVKDALEGIAEVQPIPLPNGKVLRMLRTKGWAYYDRDATTALLKQHGATDEEIASVMKVRADSVSAKETRG